MASLRSPSLPSGQSHGSPLSLRTRLRSVPKLLSFRFPQQALSEPRHLRRSRALALIIVLILTMAAFLFTGSREAHAARDGAQQRPTAGQQQGPVTKSYQDVPAA